MSAQTCKRCHAPRTGGFRYCRECGYDFDAESMDAAGAAARAKAKSNAESDSRAAKKRASGEPGRPVRRYVVRGLIAFEVLALAALGGYGILSNVTRDGGIAAIFATPRPTPTSTPTPAVTLPATGFTPTGRTTEAAVERVVDGDTIVVRSGTVELYVRYLGMDAPEAVKLDTPVQFMAPEATQANAQLVSGQTVILEQDVSESDGFGRLLRHVWVDRDGTLFLVGLELVKAGFAQATPIPPDTRYEALYADAEASAKAAGLGIWGAPPSPGPEATLPPTGPTPSLSRFLSLEPISVTADIQTFRGGIGIYEWATVTFEGGKAVVRWQVSSSSRAGCRIDWAVETLGGTPATGTVEVDGRATKKGVATISAPPADATATVRVTSTCSAWVVTMREAG
jgi:endonuclease YncB( thermonuclease family)